MNKTEAANLIRILSGLFPSRVTQEQSRVWAPRLLPFAYEPAKAAVESHKGRRGADQCYTGFPDFEGLMDVIEAGDREARTAKQSQVAERREDTWFEMQRRLIPNESIKRAGDVEVCLRVYWAQWNSDRAAGRRKCYRSQIARECRNQLLNAGVVDPGELDRLAQTVFEDARYFGEQVLPDVRLHYATLADQQARAESQQMVFA